MHNFEKAIQDSVHSLIDSREKQYKELIRPNLTQQQVEQFAMNAILSYFYNGDYYETDTATRIMSLVKNGAIAADCVQKLENAQLDTDSLKAKLQEIASGKDA